MSGIAFMLILLLPVLHTCRQPHRFDPLRQQQLQQQQEECLRRGGNPQQCRP
jgi:hypothetical protein